MVNNIAQEDQEEPTVQGKILYVPYVSLCLLSLHSRIGCVKKAGEVTGWRARVENRRTINRNEEEEEEERGADLVEEPPSQSAIEQFSLLWG